jgi:hypothetical protein
MIAPRAQIFVLLPVGQDQQQPFPHRVRLLATGAKERDSLKILIIRLGCHRLKHNAKQGNRQARAGEPYAAGQYTRASANPGLSTVGSPNEQNQFYLTFTQILLDKKRKIG